MIDEIQETLLELNSLMRRMHYEILLIDVFGWIEDKSESSNDDEDGSSDIKTKRAP